MRNRNGKFQGQVGGRSKTFSTKEAPRRGAATRLWLSSGTDARGR